MCSDGIEACFYILVATVYLVYMVDLADAFGTHCRDEHGYTGTYVGRCHVVVTQFHLVIMSDDDCAVRVA